MEQVEAAYRPGTTLEDAFAQLMRRLFPEAGLVFVNPDDRRLKAMAAPLFRQEIDAPSTTSAHVNEAGDRLEAAGYHAQVHARPTNLFLLDDDGRYPIDTDGDGGFALRGTDRTFSADALHDLLDTAPERLSPNVVLRPLMQDALLPTAAYVAGPSEVSYFAQYRAVYDAMDVPMPVIYPRASVSLVEGKVQKVLDKYDLSLPDVAGHLDQLFQDVVKAEMEVDVDEVFGDAMREIHQAVNDLKPDVEAVDRSLTPAVEATRTDLQQAMDALKTRVVKAEKRAQDEVRAQLEKARVNLVPGGTLQERVVSVLYFLNKYSLDLLDDLRDGLTLDTSAHQVVEL
jgi:bacillithiol biosynthesis cysteine-adding enzyme BshC